MVELFSFKRSVLSQVKMFSFFYLIVVSFVFISFSASARDTVLVYAASSMNSALTAVVNQYKQETGKEITVSYGASSSLARQIIYGAHADIFISANEQWMRYLVQHRAIAPESVIPWLNNSLVLIKPTLAKLTSHTSQQSKKTARNNKEVFAYSNIKRLLGHGKIALSDPSHVPAGIYAKQALVSLKLWNLLQGNFALTTSARATLALVERGEAPLGIVYLTDALASNKVQIVANFPASAHSKIIFPMALVKNAHQDAVQFFDFLKSQNALDIVIRFGFTLPRTSDEAGK